MNAFFVASEYSLVRSRLDRVQAMVKENVRGAKLAERQIEHIDEYIASCQVGITLASIGIGAVGEPAIADVLKKPFGDVLGHAAATALAVAIGYAILTVLHITFGELVPKIYTVGHAEGVARRLARPLEFFTVLFRPFSRILSALAGVILRPFGVRPEGLGEETTTSEDLKFLIARSVSGGTPHPREPGGLRGGPPAPGGPQVPAPPVGGGAAPRPRGGGGPPRVSPPAAPGGPEAGAPQSPPL